MSFRGLRVLVVDDDPRVRFVIVDELQNAGAEVTEAGDGDEALNLLALGDRFDLLLTDVRMPGVDGWTLAERARALRPKLPVLYITAWSDLPPRPVPGAEILAKPFRLVELMHRATRVIAATC